ncbi:pig-p domain containing protein [Niveomyces insectorum RCEF 264]|uniref:Pig-p domain containing protein n=1 Tax=Niveomyces insectorum RCEF 264 TaxID=1081102 RepID=A0A167N1J5_9HYPO|nr:pig-p domain containing protein [Niveomyces insectorum RCEF 264]
MAAISEDDDKPASDAHSAADDYEGDEGESYRGEEEEDDDDEDEFDEAFDLDGLHDDADAFSAEDDDDYDDDDDDDEYDVDGVDGVGVGGSGNGSGDGSALHLHHRGHHRRDTTRGSSDASGAAGAAGSPPPPSLPQPLPQHNFAPPFYGRPPTPLPPSPSLTSLLRPSRPTTPDATDDELEPVPRAAPQVPTYEYYGFALYLFSSLAFLMYLLWSYLPSPFLHALGIYYYPNRWWSLALPSFLVSTLVYIYVALAGYNTEILTLPLDSIETIVDEVANMAAVDYDGRVSVVGGSADHGRSRSRSRSNRSPSWSRAASEQHHDDSTMAGWSVAAPSHQHDDDDNEQHTRRHHHHHHHRQQQQHRHHHHQRAPSSPSPPLGKAARRDRTRDRKSKRTGTTAANGSDAGGDENLTMGGRGRAGSNRLAVDWAHSEDGSKQEQEQNHHHHHHRCHQLRTPDWKRLWSESTDAVMDIPLAGVCEVLYA